MSNKRYFADKILEWHHSENNRILPWKQEEDPYKIWLSEIILQQTTAAQGLGYYNKFIQTFPDINALAQADDQLVYKMWEGLGYYSRCKNLLKAARIIVSDHNGTFPSDYASILKLPGIGSYTAAAIISFAFKQPYAVVDGNVYRVLSRYFGIREPIDTNDGKKYYAQLAQELIKKDDPAHYNQAIMDFGATVCTPRKPLCETCPLSDKCVVYNLEEDTHLFPFKSKKIVKTERHFHYFLVLNDAQEIYIEERIQKDIWQHLHQFYLIESPSNALDMKKILTELKAVFEFQKLEEADVKFLDSSTQMLTHRKIQASFYLIEQIHTGKSQLENGFFITKNNLKKLAFPQTIFSFMSKNPYF